MRLTVLPRSISSQRFFCGWPITICVTRCSLREGRQCLGDVAPIEGDDRRTEVFGEFERVLEGRLFLRRQIVCRLDGDDDELRLQAPDESPCVPDQRLPDRPVVDADHDPLRRAPRFGDRVIVHVGFEFGIHARRDAPQGQLPQRGEVAGAEEVFQCLLRPLRRDRFRPSATAPARHRAAHRPTESHWQHRARYRGSFRAAARP